MNCKIINSGKNGKGKPQTFYSVRKVKGRVNVLSFALCIPCGYQCVNGRVRRKIYTSMAHFEVRKDDYFVQLELQT